MSRNTILKGTLILTIAGLITRLLGFFYKIFLSNTLGAELLGVYSLIFPIYGICFTLYASGIQTAISKLVAEETGHGRERNTRKVMFTGLAASLIISCTLSVLLYNGAFFIAKNYLMEERCVKALKILSCLFPFCGITACINGYYYGKKKAFVPATTQLLEQLARIFFVYFFAVVFSKGKLSVTVELAVWGIVIGELASNLYNIISLKLEKNQKNLPKAKPASYKRPLFQLALPLTLNRVSLSFLHSLETVLIPAMLKKYGMSPKEAISLLGILNGMTLPFLLFPSTLTNSLSVLLLPAVSEASAKNNKKVISHTVSISLKYSLILGIFSAAFFIFLGEDLGDCVYHVREAGSYLAILAWLCPILYATTTLSSVINGLGKAHLTFINSLAGMLLRILLLILVVPHFGMMGYLWAQLLSQLLMTVLDTFVVIKNVKFPLDAVNSIVKPGIIVFFLGTLSKSLFDHLTLTVNLKGLLAIAISGIVMLFGTLLLLKFTKSITRGEWHIS